MSGVPITDLHCPTCGNPMLLSVHWDADEGFDIQAAATTFVCRLSLPYLICRGGHRWTIKEITRSANRADEILLGDYLGMDYSL